MKLQIRGLSALITCFYLACAASAEAQQREYQYASQASSRASSTLQDDTEYSALEEVEEGQESSDSSTELASYNKFSAGSCNSCSTGSCGSGGLLGKRGGLGGRPMQVFVGAEYLYARASFSEALAYVVQDTAATPPFDEYVEYDFDYNSSYSFYGGIRLCDCGGAIVFDYDRLRSEADFTVTQDGGVDILGPFETNTTIDGDFVTGTADVDVQSYDLAFQKTIPLGCFCCDTCCDTCCGDDCCDTCCDDTCCGGGGCCGGWCPPWDITFSFALRFDDIQWDRGATAFDTLTATPVVGTSYTTQLDFEGAGARVGIGGRRYFGKRGCFSIFANGDISVLVGDMDIQTTVINAGNTTLIRNSGRRVVPVTEIEVGGSLHMRSVTASAGYFLSAWHDLGMRDTYNFATSQLSHYDDANILGFDGLFARIEMGF